MGIFDLFKSSPEELKAKEDAKRSRNLIANKEWDQLVEIGKPVVEPLISCLTNNNDADFVASVAETLGKIGDVRAIKSLCLCLFDTDALLHDRMNWNYYENVMPAVAKALINMGEPVIEQVTKDLKKDTPLLLYGIPKVWALCEIGDKKTTETVVNWILSVGPMAPIVSFGKPLIYQKKFLSPLDLIRSILPPEVLPKLLGDYTHLILDTFAWELASYSETTDRLQFNLSRCSEAIQGICEIKTPISSNILHNASKIDKVNVGLQHGSVESRTEYLDFKQYQQMAKDELKHRGNPRYDPSVYLNQDVWRIDK